MITNYNLSKIFSIEHLSGVMPRYDWTYKIQSNGVLYLDHNDSTNITHERQFTLPLMSDCNMKEEKFDEIVCGALAKFCKMSVNNFNDAKLYFEKNHSYFKIKHILYPIDKGKGFNLLSNDNGIEIIHSKFLKDTFVILEPECFGVIAVEGNNFGLAMVDQRAICRLN